MWTRLTEIAGFDVAEKIRQEFAGETIRVPKKLPKTFIVPLVKQELRSKDYGEVAKKYGLSERTIRDYARWSVEADRLVSPDGKVYFLKEDPL